MITGIRRAARRNEVLVFSLLVKDVVVDFHPITCELNSIQWHVVVDFHPMTCELNSLQ
jgi:hypothetical protein